MPRLIMCKGLPGSGKSTWAIQRVLESQMSQDDASQWWERVNKDDIRRELEKDGWVWSREGEADVEFRRDDAICRALSQGRTVISDDTNYAEKHERALRGIAASFGAAFEIKEFLTGVPECIRRDAQREGKARVGAAVIYKMAKQYDVGNPIIERYKLPDVDHSMQAVICDLDGTLAHRGDRGIYEFEKCDGDGVDSVVRDICRAYAGLKWQHQIIYLTGREEKFRLQTQAFLSLHQCPVGPLHMRSTGDPRNDAYVKLELFNAHVRHRYAVRFVLDDRNRVVDMWRSIGLKCLQVAAGDF